MENQSDQQAIKFADSINSDEIMVFTTSANVYKVPKTEIYSMHQALERIDFEEGEKAIYLTGDKKYSGYIIAGFENGKVAKIAMSSFKTEFKRKKLVKAYNKDSKLVFIERIDDDIDLVSVSSINKVVLFNTAHINPVESRTTKGVQVMKQKDGSRMVSMMKADQTKLSDPEFYRKGLNVVGFYLKKGDEV